MASQPRRHMTVLFMPLALILSSAYGMAQDVKVTSKPGQDISKFVTYTWKENRIAPGQLPKERQAIEASIKDIVNRELSKKGYREDAQKPDFLVQVEAAALPSGVMSSANPDLRVPSNVAVYDSQAGGAGAGVRVWMAVTAGVRIIVTDSSSSTAAWEAVVTKKYKNPDKYKERDRLQKEIELFFQKGMKDFPARKSL